MKPRLQRFWPPSLAVLSGAAKPGVCVMARTPDGEVAACAAAAFIFHPDHPQGASSCWWGMLAVHPDHRGQALSLHLGALAMVRMHERHGFSHVFTGIDARNAASTAVCARLGLSHADRSIVVVSDPALLPCGRLTK